MSATRFASLTMLVSLAHFAQHVLADDYLSPTDERVRVSIGATYLNSATTLQADSNAGVSGTLVSGEDQFGLDKSRWEPDFQVLVRVGTRQRLSIDYFTLDRSGSSIVGATPLLYGDVTFLPGDPLQTQLNLRTLGITYEYSFWHSETVEIAATLGVHATDISSTAKVQTQTRHIIQEVDEAGPVPTVGLDATWVISKRFYVDGRAQYLNVHVDNVDGSLGLYEFQGLYRFRPNMSLGVGYSEVRAHIASTQGSTPGVFEFNSKGPEIFVRVSF